MYQGKCRRWKALYRPGEAMRGVVHRFVWDGAIPRTGRQVCVLCGAQKQNPEAMPRTCWDLVV